MKEGKLGPMGDVQVGEEKYQEQEREKVIRMHIILNLYI